MRHQIALIAGVAFCLTNVAVAQASEGNASAAPYGSPVEDQHIYVQAVLDQFEGRFGANDSFRWEGEGWAGTDMNRIWLKSEGEVSGGNVEDGQHELLYDRPINSFFDLQTGVRLDADSGVGRTWAAFGIEGLAPLFFHVSATGYVSDQGHFAAKLEGSYDLLLTQQLILQPQIEMNLYTKSDLRRDIGSGLSDLDMGLRLRYEITRKFAPYIGVTYENKFGGTAGFAQLRGDKSSELRFAAGLRVWL